MIDREYKFYSGTNSKLFTIIITALLALVLFVLSQYFPIELGSYKLLAALQGAFLLLLLYFLTKPAYILSPQGIIQFTPFFTKNQLEWRDISRIIYKQGMLYPLIPGTILIVFKSSPPPEILTPIADNFLSEGLIRQLRVKFRNRDSLGMIITVSALSRPKEFMELLRSQVKVDADDEVIDSDMAKTQQSQENFTWLSLFYINAFVPMILIAYISGPYVWQFDTTIARVDLVTFMVFFVLVFSTSIFFYRRSHLRAKFIKTSFIIWSVLLIAPFVLDKSVQYGSAAVFAGKRGNFSDARYYIEKAAEINPKKSASLYETMGDIYFDAGNYDQAIEMFKDSLGSRGPYRGYCHFMIGKSLIMLGRIDEAKHHFDRIHALGYSHYDDQIRELLATK